MNASGITRRGALGAGLAVASLGGSTIAAATPASVAPVDALLVDDGLVLPPPLAAFVAARRRTLPVAAIRLDAAGHADLARLLSTSRCVLGFGSGATLFCVERIAWDHGFRLIGRSQRDDADPADDLLAFLAGAQPFAAHPAASARTYRPSRADGALHVWTLRKAPAQGTLRS